MSKVKRQTLSDRVSQKRLELEEKLLESQLDALNFVDPRDAYRDESGMEWDEVGGAGGFLDESIEPFRNENELAQIRRRCRRMVQRNPYAENFLNSLVSFVVGKGHQYRVTTVKNQDASEEQIQLLQEYVDELLKLNKWKKRQKEVYRRMHRDGETFLRVFFQDDGFAKFRFVEPHEVSTPRGFTSKRNYSFGIKTDEDDVETVESYFVQEEEVPYYEMQHRKMNVDMNIKRGLSSIWCVLANLDRGQNLLRNMSTVVATQASVALIRKHESSPAQVKSFVQNAASEQVYNPSTGETRNFRRLRPGTIIDARKGTEYEFPAVGLNAAEPVQVLQAECRAIASAKSMPEYMVGADSSNSNYSNTMVAESPAVRYFESEQEEMIEADLDLIKSAIEHAMDTGRLPVGILEQCQIVVTAPMLVSRDPKSVAETDQIYMQARVKSPQTVQGEQGLDSDEEMENWRQFDDQMYPQVVVDPMTGAPVQQGTPSARGVRPQGGKLQPQDKQEKAKLKAKDNPKQKTKQPSNKARQ